MEKEPEIIRTSLRLPKELYDKLLESAGTRTMHAEILARLESSFTVDEQFSTVTSEAISSLEQSLQEARTTLDQMHYMASQIKMMRYLLDQVALYKGDLPEILLDTITALANSSNPSTEPFDTAVLLKLAEEAIEAINRADESWSKFPLRTKVKKT
nr:MAG TPA: hypothetical protein [Caudoviricetes sp.]